jgi:transcriptional regulator with XRE-family HTH domain
MHLANYMARQDLSDEAVATAIGRSRVSVSRYRRKLVRPDWDTIEAIRAFTKGAVTEADWRKVRQQEAA